MWVAPQNVFYKYCTRHLSACKKHKARISGKDGHLTWRVSVLLYERVKSKDWCFSWWQVHLCFSCVQAGVFCRGVTLFNSTYEHTVQFFFYFFFFAFSQSLTYRQQKQASLLTLQVFVSDCGHSVQHKPAPATHISGLFNQSKHHIYSPEGKLS